MKLQNKLLIKKGGSSLLEDSSNNIPIPDNTWSFGLNENAGVVDNMLSNEFIQDGSGKGVKKSVSKKPAVKKSISEKPVVKKSVSKKPVVKKSISEKPVVKKSTTEKQVVKKSVAKKSNAKESSPEKPVSKKSVAKKSTPEEPVSKKSIQNILKNLVNKVKNLTK